MGRPFCKEHVFSGARHDTAGHRCGNLALEGSEFCALHQPNPERPTAPATAEPTVYSQVSRIYHAQLEWAPGEGPLVPIPYQSRSGFIVLARAKAANDGDITVEVRGVVAKKNGDPGIQPWDSTWQSEKLLSAEHLATLLGLIEQQRNAPSVTEEMVAAFKRGWHSTDDLGASCKDQRRPGDRTRAGLEAALRELPR